MENEKKFIDYVLKFIKDEFNLTLPNFGMIAGQSIAELYFRFYNIPIKTRIKDVDLFVLDSELYKSNVKKYLQEEKGDKNLHQKFSIKSSLSEPKSGRVDVLKTLSLSEGLINYEQNEVDFVDVINNVVISREVKNSFVSINNELLNITIFDVLKTNSYRKTKEEEMSYSEKNQFLVDDFDFNSVAIGIDLKEKKVVISERFKMFVKTHYVEMKTDMSSINMSTLIRYFDKREYYSGAIFNIEQEIYPFLLLFSGVKILERRIKKSIYERYEKLSDESKLIINNYFNVDKISVMVFDNSSLELGNKLERIKKLSLLKLETKEKYKKEILNKLGLFLNRILNVENFYDIFIYKKILNNKTLYSRIFNTDKDLNSLYVYLMDISFVDMKYFNSLSVLNLRKNELSIIKKHPRLFMMNKLVSVLMYGGRYKNIGEYITDIVNRVRFLEKVGKGYLVGLFESGSVDFNLIFKDVDYIESVLRKTNWYESTNYDLGCLGDFSESSCYKIEQLKNRVDLMYEGNRMSHCIGGYSLNDRMMHFTLLNKKINERVTFSILFFKNEDGRKKVRFNIAEMRSKRNNNPSKSSIDIINKFVDYLEDSRDNDIYNFLKLKEKEKE